MAGKPLAKTFADAAAKGPSESISYNYHNASTKPGAMDCQEFVENRLKQVGIIHNWAGSNAMFRDMAWVGTPEECKAKFGCIPAGAWLFILAFDGGEVARGYHDGKGNANHVGIYTGVGKGAVHSSASKGCVCESAFSGKTIPNGGWNRVGLCGLLDWGDTINNQLNGGGNVMESNATVTASTGKTVKLRSAPKVAGNVLAEVPIGADVIQHETDGTWSAITYAGTRGYMMSKFLTTAGASTSASTGAVTRAEFNAVLARLAALEGRG